MTATFMNTFYEPFVHALKKPGVVPHPHSLWNALALLNQLVFLIRKCGSWEGIRSCTTQPRLSQGWSIEGGWGPGRPVKGYDQLANRCLPYCRYAGIVLLEENIVSNSLIDLQDLLVKALINIALASKRPPSYYAN